MSLADLLRTLIQTSGPITFRDWIEAALYHPQYGYYCKTEKTRWGREGDYRTSPERTQLFAATFAHYFASLDAQLGTPDTFTVVEAGAGGGYFAHSLLASMRERFQQLYSRMNYLIDELSGESSNVSTERLTEFTDKVRPAKLEDVAPVESGVVFGNELLDAFPVHRVTVQERQLREFYVGVNSSNEFEWQLRPVSTTAIERYFSDAGVFPSEGQIAEVNLEIDRWLALVASKLTSGFVVLVDYGADASDLFTSPHYSDGSLRAFRSHQLVSDLLSDPGEQDLTTTVDWTHVKAAGEKLGFETVTFERQDRFLLENGLLDELERQTATANAATAAMLRTEAREMILPSGMAASFQVLVLKRSVRTTSHS
jgi:SAM-dependent MidA family methyltransferase